MKKYKGILIILDGLGDLQYEELGNKSPLEAAFTPNIDYLASNGETGFFHSIGKGIIPGSDTAHLAIFGYPPQRFYQGRGVYEALGADIKLKPGDVAFRANIGTINENGIIIDRRAGRNDYLLKEILGLFNGIKIEDVEVIAKHTVEHRGAVVFRGIGLSNQITDIDPHKTGVKYLESKPLHKTASAEKTARILNKFTELTIKILKNHEYNQQRIAKGLLPGNIILLRGAGSYTPVNPISNRLSISMACIAGGALYKGVAKFVGMHVYHVPGATGDKNTDLKAKALMAVKVKDNHDIVFLHIKATDSFGHDGNFIGKMRFIEKVDREVIPIIKDHFDLIVITGDHSTPAKRKEHSADAVPILIYGINTRKDQGYFSEVNPHPTLFLEGKDILPVMLNKLELAKKYGE